MTIKVRIPCAGAWLEADSESVKDSIAKLAPFTEFYSNSKCGKCGGPAMPDHRQDDEGHDYYSMKCTTCNAQLDFGQTKKGGLLFAKRKDCPETAGWHIWQERKAST